MSASEHDLVAEEGVDQGSAASSTEGDAGPDLDAVGPPVTDRPQNPEQEAAPDVVETPASRRAEEGQRQQVGEG